MDIKNLPVLTQEQVRVMSSLMEKHLATPKNYPLTVNSLMLACNQKSNRYPTMALEEGKVAGTAQQLKELGYVSIDYSERVVKYSHRAPGVFKVTREEQAVLAMLMLREPLTLSDIKARTDKMVGFETIDQVKEAVNQLINRTPALVVQLPISTGQREDRFTHLLAGKPDLSDMPVTQKPSSSGRVKANLEQTKKIAELEARVQRLEGALDMVWKEQNEVE